MPTERLAPDALLVQTALSGSVTAIDDDPDSPAGDWLTYDTAVNGNTDCRVSFPTPTGNPTTGAGVQNFRVQIRKNASAGNSTTWSLQLWENGAQVAELATGTTTSTTGEVVAGAWNASSLGTANGSLVECRLQQTAGGASGSGGNRRRIEIGAVEWNVTYDDPPAESRALVTFAELEVPTAPRRALASFAELEAPTAPRRAIASWAEVEAPGAPRRAIATHAELEAPSGPRRALATWAEAEVPTAPRRALVSFAETEAPTAPRRATVTVAELEAPNGPRRAVVTWSEAEAPTAPRRALVAHAELETGAPPRRCLASWAELETPDAATTDRRCLVTSAYLQTPNARAANTMPGDKTYSIAAYVRSLQDYD